MNEEIVMIRLKEVMKITAISKGSIYAGIKAGTFPKMIKLGERSSGWVSSEKLDAREAV